MKNAGKVVVPTLFALLAAIVFYLGWMFVFVFVAVTLGACVLGLALAVRSFFAKVASENAQVKALPPSQEELCPFSRAELIVEYLQVCLSLMTSAASFLLSYLALAISFYRSKAGCRTRSSSKTRHDIRRSTWTELESAFRWCSDGWWTPFCSS